MNDIRKVAFVTGASRGIGRAIVEKLASDGFKVGFSYVSSDEKAKAIVDELTAKGLEVYSVKFDVKNFQEVEDAFDKIYEEHGRIDVLVNNAGITRDKLFSRMKEDDFDQVID
ncbi:MAG: SDR family NAD(P)-dependent oxidoreductase, partial [Peptostreptococcus sp.]|uniref:SDR family NAD(P)-dependent oxidoreductase n=1 Tax=Peptostreptococcus sp. TaxID=1262 RepID=UPI001CB5F882